MTKDICDFRETLRRFEREISIQNDNCCNTGISMGQCHMVLDIDELKKTSVTELAEVQNLDKSTVSRTIDNLYKKNLINREINPDSRRQSIVSLTEKGEKVCEEINALNDKFFDEAFSGVSQTDFDTFSKVLKKVTNKMTQLRLASKNCCL